MINKILSRLGLGDGSLNSDPATRRKYIRYATSQAAEVVAGSRAYPLRDWSLGGVSFEMLPDSRLAVGDRLDLVLRFRLPTDTITVQQTGRVVRTGRRGIAAEFLPGSPDARRGLERVIDSVHAQNFLQSQSQVA